MSVERILKAVDATVPGGADILVADAVWDEVYPRYIQARDALITKALDPDVLESIRKTVLRAYLRDVNAGGDGVSKAADLLDGFDQLVTFAKYTEQINRDGWVQYVNRDQSGRFSRTARGTGMDPQALVRNKKRVPGTLTPLLSRAGEYQGAAADDAPNAEVVRNRMRGHLSDLVQAKNLKDELSRKLSQETLDNSRLIVRFKDRDIPDMGFDNWADRDTEFTWALEDGRVHSFDIVPLDGADPKVAAELNVASKLDLLGMSQASTEQMKQIAQILNPNTQETTRVSRLASLLSGAGGAASAVGLDTLGQTLRQAGAATEAGEALRPALTRAAYRYRGTEKTSVDQQFQDAAALSGHGDADRVAISALTDPKAAGKTLSGELKSAAKTQYSRKPVAGKGELARAESAVMPVLGQRVQMWEDNDTQDRPATVDQLRLGVQRDLVAQEFVRRQTRDFARRTKESTAEGGSVGTGIKPLRQLIQDLAQGIGRDLPSEGVVIDANGKVVTQATGIGGDHYQPFNLKGRKALEGGQYVRTRQLGGLTTDDLRTLLTSNARAGMVVSASGVFDIEFDPSFRNQKRLSERALGMVDTYERILDQLAASNIYARDLDPKTKAELHEKAKAQVKRSGGDVAAVEQDMIDAKREEMSRLSAEDEAKLLTQAKELRGTPAAVSAEFEKLKADKIKAKVATLGLNAEGYEVALRTLQSYYPYFIRDVSRRDISEFMSASDAYGPTMDAYRAVSSAEKAKDKQYVRPGAVRSGNDKNAGFGLPKQKLRPFTGMDDKPSATADGAPPSGGGAAPQGGTVRTPPDAQRGAIGGREPEPGTTSPVSGGSAPAEDVSPVLGRVALAVRNNAKNVYALVPTLFNDDNGEVMSSDIAGSKQLLEDAMRESGEDEDWHEKAFGASVTSPSDRELRYLLDAQSNPKDVLTRVAKWVNGDASKQRALQALVAGTSNVTSPEIGDAMMASANLAYTASVAQKPWRAARDQSGDRTTFDLRPAAVSELRDAETPEQVWSGIQAAVKSAEADLGEFPDSAVLGAPATSQDDLTAKREMHGVIQQYMLGAQRIDDWLAKGTTADGTQVAQASPETVLAELDVQNSEDINGWLWVRGTGDSKEDAFDQDSATTDAQWEAAEKFYAAASASMAQDAAAFAAGDLFGVRREGNVPKALAPIGAKEVPQDVLDLVKLPDSEQMQRLRVQMDRVLFNKSLRSRRGVRVARDRALVDKVQRLVGKGVPPKVAAVRSVRRTAS